MNSFFKVISLLIFGIFIGMLIVIKFPPPLGITHPFVSSISPVIEPDKKPTLQVLMSTSDGKPFISGTPVAITDKQAISLSTIDICDAQKWPDGWMYKKDFITKPILACILKDLEVAKKKANRALPGDHLITTDEQVNYDIKMEKVSRISGMYQEALGLYLMRHWKDE